MVKRILVYDLDGGQEVEDQFNLAKKLLDEAGVAYVPLGMVDFRGHPKVELDVVQRGRAPVSFSFSDGGIRHYMAHIFPRERRTA